MTVPVEETNRFGNQFRKTDRFKEKQTGSLNNFNKLLENGLKWLEKQTNFEPISNWFGSVF
jgi:hypothetical protein